MIHIDGRDISGHPFRHPVEFRKVSTVLAEQADSEGWVSTPEGSMHFSEGDYICTDNPPTHAWPVKKEVFERTYEPLMLGVSGGLIDTHGSVDPEDWTSRLAELHGILGTDPETEA